MRLSLFTRLSLALLVGCPTIALAADSAPVPSFVRGEAMEEAWRVGWPQLHGPTCNGMAPDLGLRLVDDFSKAREAWVSEAFVPPAEINSGGCLRSSYATPVVADGRVYQYYTWPQGFPQAMADVTAEKIKALDDGRRDRTDRSNHPGDDVILCVEAATGKTLWKRVYKGQGETLLGSGKGGGHGTMCIWQGKAYAFGMAGWVYCLDAVTGEDIWVEHLQPNAHSPNGTPVVAEGVLIYYRSGMLFGYDAATGEKLWHNGDVFQGGRDASFTRVWPVGNRELLVHENACYDPRTGKELWNIGAMEGGNTTAVFDNYMVTREANKKEGPHGVRCFRISPQGAELVWWWQEPFCVKGWSSPVFTPDGWVAVDAQSPWKDDKGTKVKVFVMLELATGKAVTMPGHHKAWKYQPIATEGTYIYTGGYNVWMTKLDPTDLKELSNTKIHFSHDTSPAYVCGLLFVRDNGHLRCFDLRAR